MKQRRERGGGKSQADRQPEDLELVSADRQNLGRKRLPLRLQGKPMWHRPVAAIKRWWSGEPVPPTLIPTWLCCSGTPVFTGLLAALFVEYRSRVLAGPISIMNSRNGLDDQRRQLVRWQPSHLDKLVGSIEAAGHAPGHAHAACAWKPVGDKAARQPREGPAASWHTTNARMAPPAPNARSRTKRSPV
jgi:hypothetical protein